MISTMLALCATSTPTYAAQAPQAEEQTHLLNDSIIKDTDALFGKLHETCNQAAFLLKSTQIKATKEERGQYMQALAETRGLIQMVQRAMMTQPTAEAFTHLFGILTDIIDHIQQGINNSFAGFTAFEPKETRTPRTEPYTDTEIEALLKEKTELVTTIQKKSEDAGLFLRNRIFRKTLAVPINELFIKRKAHWWIGAAALTTALAAYGWYHFCNDQIWGREFVHPVTKESYVPHLYTENDSWLKRKCIEVYEWWNNGVFSVLGSPLEDSKDEFHNQQVRMAKQLLQEAFKDDSVMDNMRKVALNRTKGIFANLDPADASIMQEILGKTVQTVTIDGKEVPISYADIMHEAFASAMHDATANGADAIFSYMDPKHANALQIHQKLLAKIERFGHKSAVGGAVVGGALVNLINKHGLIDMCYKAKEKIDHYIHYGYAWAMGGAYLEQFKTESYSFEIEPRYTFDDIIGQEHAKEDLQDVIKYMEDPEKYLRSGLKPIGTILLYGDTRTGKTMLVEALAGELRKKKTRTEFPFYRFSAHHIVQNTFEILMHIMSENAPCVIFIDEFDQLDLNREGNKKQLAEFLNTLSGCMNSSPDKPVIFIAACNTPNKLDTALRERFTKEIPFEKPSFENRMIYFTDQLIKKGLSFHPMEIQVLSSLTDGRTLDKISKIIELTCFRKSRSGTPVTMQDIIETINTDVHKVMPHNFKDLAANEKQLLAIHMTGHMFATMWMNNPYEQLSQVTIRPVKNAITKEYNMHDPTVHYGEVFTCNPGDTLGFENQEYYKAKCIQKLAGLIAEEVLLGKQHITKYSCSCKDKSEALGWAKKYCLNGLDEKELQESKHLKEQLATDARAFVQACETELREKIAKDVELIAFVAEQLVQIESLDVSSLQILMKAHPKVQGGMSLGKAFQEAMQEIQEEFEQQMAAMQNAGTPDETALFNH
jgi:ATP-dependent Zn protease